MKPTTPRRPRCRPQLELLESRLQPGSLLSSLGAALADTTLADLNPPPTPEHARLHRLLRPDATNPAGVPALAGAPNTSPSTMGHATTGAAPVVDAAPPAGRSVQGLAEEALAVSAADRPAAPGRTTPAATGVAAHAAGGSGSVAPALRAHAAGPAVQSIPTQGAANAVVVIPNAVHTIPMRFTSVRHWHAGDGNSPPPSALAWATYVTGTGTDAAGLSVATDPNQNAYVAGSEGDGDAMMAFVAEYAVDGTPIYYNEFQAIDPTPGFTYGQTAAHAIAVDADGNAYVAGAAVRQETGNTQAFCMKLDAGGNIVNGYGGGVAAAANGDSSGDGIAVDALGQATLVGSAYFPLAHATYAAAVKYNAQGGAIPIYAAGYQVTGFGDSAAKAVALDDTGDNAYLVGSIYAPAASATSILALKIDNAGPMAGRHVSYTVTATSDPGPDVLNGVAVDGDGNAYIVGTVTYQGPANAYAAELNADGSALLYTDIFDSTVGGTGVARDNDNNVTYICGSGILPDDGRVHGVVAELDANGAVVDAYVTAGDTMDVSQGVAFNGGIAFMVGATSSTQLSTDGTTLNGTSDAFLMAVSDFA